MEKKQKRRIGGVWQDPDSGVWRYRFMHRGKRYFGADPTWKNKGEAKAARDRRRIAVREDREDKAEADTNFKAFVEDRFLPHIETNKSPGTYQSYKWRCDDLIEAFGKLDLSQVSEIGIERFKREQLKRKTKRGAEQSAASVNRYLQILASIFTRAEILKLRSKDDRPKIETLREDNQRLRYLSTDEEKRLLAAAAAWPWLEEIIIVGLATGLRRDELFSLRKDDIDLSLNLVNVLDGKGGKARSVPLDPEGEARRILERLRKDSRSEWIFTSPHSGAKLTRVDKSIAKACELAKIEPATLHTLRHTFCTRLAAAGVDVRTIKELAGHGDLATTMRYMHLVESNKHQAIRRLSNYHEITTAEVVPMKQKAG
jgi:site-specific recombinase XerD